jgi:putative ABC transport system substrate-binding protein
MVRLVRRGLAAILAVVAAVGLIGCGDDGKPARTIGFLRVIGIPAENQKAFLDELAAAGWKTGDNLTVLSRDPNEGHPDPAEAQALVEGWKKDDVDLVVALSTPSATAAEKAGGTTPILTLASDPVASGLLANPDEPEGRITGMAYRTPPDRTIDVATRVTDHVDKVGILWPSTDPSAKPGRDGLVQAARTLSVDTVDESFSSPDDVGRAVDALAAEGADVVIGVNSADTTKAYDAIGAALRRNKLPSVANIVTAPYATVVLAPDPVATYRQLGKQAARLLGGTDVADVPIEDPGEYHLTVRTDLAKELGVELSPELVSQADELASTTTTAP